MKEWINRCAFTLLLCKQFPNFVPFIVFWNKRKMEATVQVGLLDVHCFSYKDLLINEFYKKLETVYFLKGLFHFN